MEKICSSGKCEMIFCRARALWTLGRKEGSKVLARSNSTNVLIEKKCLLMSRAGRSARRDHSWCQSTADKGSSGWLTVQNLYNVENTKDSSLDLLKADTGEGATTSLGCNEDDEEEEVESSGEGGEGVLEGEKSKVLEELGFLTERRAVFHLVCIGV